jgi:hypothetical protein
MGKIHVKGKPLAFVTNDYFTWKGGDTYAKFHEFQKNKKYDIVVLGSSRAYRGYNPAFFGENGYTMFNLGSSAQSIRNSFFIARNYLDSSNTGLLMIDIFSGAFKKMQLESSSDLIENVDNRDAAMDIAFHTPDIRALNITMLRLLTENDEPYFVKKDYAGNGFSIKTDSLSKKMRKAFKTFKQPVKATYEIDPDALDSFDELLQWCNDKKIPVVVVYSPVSDFYSRIDHAEFMKSVRPVLEKHHVPFYDYTSSVHLSTIDNFYDETHMNLSGVSIFNKILLQDLQERGNLAVRPH